MEPEVLRRAIEKHFEETSSRQVVKNLCDLAVRMYTGKQFLDRGESRMRIRSLESREEREDFREEFLAEIGVDIEAYMKDPESVLSKYSSD